MGKEQPDNYPRAIDVKEGILSDTRIKLRELRFGIESDFEEKPVLAIDEVTTRLSIADYAVSLLDYKGERFGRMRRTEVTREKNNPALLSQKTIDDIGVRTTENSPCRPPAGAA